jgi:predicted ATPase
MPSSRVRISAFHKQEKEGLYVHGVEIKNRFFGKRIIRFNRHLNCVSGKKGSGKSFLFDLIQSAVNPDMKSREGEVTLFVEKVIDSISRYYCFYKSANGGNLRTYAIDQNGESVEDVKHEDIGNLDILPKFYQAERMEAYISSRENLNELIIRHFGKPTNRSIKRFNKLFSIPDFLEEKEDRLLSLEQTDDGYKLLVNGQWRKGKEKMTDFFSLSHSMRKTALMCMIIIASDFGPAIIDSPESHFDNEDVMNFLVPIIKRYKDFQQVILFTNNPLLAVNTDPDNYILLESTGERFKDLASGFAIDDEKNRQKLLGILEGSLESFHRRAKRYSG